MPRAPLDPSRATSDTRECERAIIGDKRNDENSIVVQIHALFLQFHNTFLRECSAPRHGRPGLAPEAAFPTAHRRVRWHYQWIVLHDFLRRIVGPKTHAAVWNNGDPDLRFYQPEAAAYPFMPVEFSVGAYRYGHSMVRPSYMLNSETPKGPKRLPIFTRDFSCAGTKSLNGFRPLPDTFGIDWSFFLPGLAPAAGHLAVPQPSYRIDTLLVDPLADLPDQAGQERQRRSLPSLNLLRALALGLPSGQAVARRMSIEPLTDEQLWLDPGNLVGDSASVAPARARVYRENKAALHKNAPLWYYILREAELEAVRSVEIEGENGASEIVKLGGWHLGAVGGRIVAEVVIGLLVADRQSFLIQNPLWKPEIPIADMVWGLQLSDVVRYVDAASGKSWSPPSWLG